MTYVGSRPANKPVNQTDIEDDAISLAKLAGGTDGNVISYDASGNPVAIATGSDGQVLTSTGAGSPPAFETISAGVSLSGSTNNTVATLSGANALVGEATLLYDGTLLNVGADTDAGYNPLQLGSTSDNNSYIQMLSSVAGQIHFGDATSGDAREIGVIQYRHDENVMKFKTNGSYAMVVHSNGVISANAGVALGVGIANTASNVLDDYEEGEWTASVGVDSGAMTLEAAFNTGTYVKIGSMVNVQGFFKVDATSAGSGYIGINGLPFASGALTEGGDYSSGACFVRSASSAIAGGVICWMEGSGQSMVALRENGTTAVGNTLTSHFDAGTDFTLNITYRTA